MTEQPSRGAGRAHLVVRPDTARRLNELAAHLGASVDEVLADAVATLHAAVFYPGGRSYRRSR